MKNIYICDNQILINMKALLSLITLALLLLSSCQNCDDKTKNAKSVATVEHLKQHTEALAHDSCQGRKPFSDGAKKATDYIAREMRKVGLKPFDGDSYFQEVGIISATTECPQPMRLTTPKGVISLNWLEEYTAFSAVIGPQIDINDAELVFAGYGIVAPEYGKNDFYGIENPENKVAVVLVNDPGLGNSDSDYFKGDIMTYYGRWKYKFEEGSRQGLKGILIIHDDRGAGYPWSVVRASAKSKMYVDGKSNAYHSPLKGWFATMLPNACSPITITTLRILLSSQNHQTSSHSL